MKKQRVTVVLVCSECKARNYRTTKRSTAKIALEKYCKSCRKHTLHQDSK